ncbi:neutral zinc metallopeptidase [Kibdelosporangium phytohabitans]|uniref:Metalloprotease-like protein n=1 Tax=Kibdelosporangium phytohabitans TaxID=860235 RepID=A0A0N9ID45_9PSEU|nr:neutral zinc metallopeptidase [Kibdelosporangium phytohabitans]ALG13230.1 metalloprotease-like protein [Kibdelosporangium phytohabitans]MBE1464997.1 putative metalloprotease [Kibdelosporangium phytohabitans]
MIRSFGAVSAVLVSAVVLSACTVTVQGTPLGAGRVINPDKQEDVDTSFINNTDGGEIDKLAGTVIKDVEKFWEDGFPATFDDKPWQPLRGGYYSVDTSDKAAPPPPCTDQASDVEGNAFYCPSADIIAWDRASLLPVLKEKFGEAAVMLVLAHEMGHAVQRRAGITQQSQRNDPQRYPTILLESQADCYAGSFVRWVSDGKAANLSLDRDSLDPALEAMVLFKDPVGTEQTAQGAHGDAFDRVSAFQDGFEKGAKLCSEITVDNRVFTQRGFISRQDEATGGNLPFDQAIQQLEPDLNAFMKGTADKLGKQWPTPKLDRVTSSPRCSKGDQGPVAYCPNDKTIDMQTKGKLTDLHAKIGDWATGTIVSSRYAVSLLAVLGKPLTGPEAQRTVLCVSGAYSKFLLTREGNGVFTLSPGDLDEAVQVLLGYDYPARDVDGEAPATGFERVAAFRTGAVDGINACDLR